MQFILGLTASVYEALQQLICEGQTRVRLAACMALAMLSEVFSGGSAAAESFAMTPAMLESLIRWTDVPPPESSEENDMLTLPLDLPGVTPLSSHLLSRNTSQFNELREPRGRRSGWGRASALRSRRAPQRLQRLEGRTPHRASTGHARVAAGASRARFHTIFCQSPRYSLG